jgi:hypothetical protein
MDQARIMQANATIVVASIVAIDPTRNNAVIPCPAGGKAFGVSDVGSRDASIPSVLTTPAEAAWVGESIKVYTEGHTCLLRAGTGGVVAGNEIKSGDATGVGVKCTDAAGALKEYSVGTALETAAAGELFNLLVSPKSLYNA